MDPIIISVAPNGPRKTKKDHPHIPLTMEEIANEARNCADAGATLLHLHIRDKNLKHSLDVDTYRQTIKAIRNKVSDRMIIQATSESAGIYKPNEQMRMVFDLKPTAVSLAVREIIPTPNEEENAKRFFEWMAHQKILPQYILYNAEEVKYFADLRKRGIVPGEKAFVLFVLGNKTGAPDSYARPEDLDPFLECFGDGIISLADTVWTVTAFGKMENACVKRAVECGGHPRIGFENNLWMADGSVAENNSMLIEQFKKSIGNTRKIADVETTRKLLNI